MYYVYLLSYPESKVPFYVGVGKVNRRSNVPREQQHIVDAKKLAEGKKLNKANLHKLHTINKILATGQMPLIEKLSTHETEIAAFEEEVRLIKLYGRKDLGLGPLTNLTDGGEGGVNPSPLTVAKIKAKNTGRPSPLKGVKVGPHSEQRCKNISKSLRGRKATEQAIINKKQAIEKRGGPWNKGLTKETSPSVAKYSVSNPNKGFKKGNVPSNKGKRYVYDAHGVRHCLDRDDPRLQTEEFVSIHKGRPAPNKGMTMSYKGKTYEEIYGPEKAAELKANRSATSLRRWAKYRTEKDK
jgi:hypothetical protein